MAPLELRARANLLLLQKVLELTSTLIPLQQLCKPPGGADALQPHPTLQARNCMEQGVFLLSQHNPRTHTENTLTSSS